MRNQAPPLGGHHPPRPETLQHSGEVGLHAEDTGLRAGEAGWWVVHDDTVRGHQVLQVGVCRFGMVDLKISSYCYCLKFCLK